MSNMHRRRRCVHRLAFKREASGPSPCLNRISVPFLNFIPVPFLNCVPVPFLTRLRLTLTQHEGAAACASPFGQVLGTALGVAGTPSVKTYFL
jgi:hypothetical protein